MIALQNAMDPPGSCADAQRAGRKQDKIPHRSGGISIRRFYLFRHSPFSTLGQTQIFRGGGRGGSPPLTLSPHGRSDDDCLVGFLGGILEVSAGVHSDGDELKEFGCIDDVEELGNDKNQWFKEIIFGGWCAGCQWM